MRNLRLAIVLVITLAGFRNMTAQTAPVSSNAPSQMPAMGPASQSPDSEKQGNLAAPASASKVAPGAAVITIHGLCSTGQTSSAKDVDPNCKTVITRAEFEKLANSLQPDMPQQLRQQLANQYPQIIFMAQEARKRGLENDPHYLAVLKFTKMELLRMELQRSIEAEAAKVPESEIQDYYRQNKADFEQAAISRVFIPKSRQNDGPKPGATPEEAQKSREESTAAMTKLADDLHTRAAAGEDFDKLQKEAYETAGMKSPIPPSLNPKTRRAMLPASQASVFDMKPGELSPVINETQGFVFYRMESKTNLALPEVREEIKTMLQNARLQAVRSKMDSAVSADLNKDYFGEPQASPAGSGIRPSDRPRPTRPVVQPQQ